MDTATFWSLIETAHADAGGDVAQQTARLMAALATLEPREIVEFDRLFREGMYRAYRWDLWAAAYIVNGGCSDDGFEYFRAWLIAQGERAFQEALADPESLVDRAAPDVDAEDMLYVAEDAYAARTGDDLPPREAGPAEPAGERWDEDDLEEMYPTLWARFG